MGGVGVQRRIVQRGTAIRLLECALDATHEMKADYTRSSSVFEKVCSLTRWCNRLTNVSVVC